jgi:hypothetical protein
VARPQRGQGMEEGVSERIPSCPVKKGDRFYSLRTNKGALVLDVRWYSVVLGWHAKVLLDGTTLTNLTCSNSGIRGYRRRA